MFNSTFADPTGLSPENISTAFDLSKLIFEAMNKEKISQAVMKSDHFVEIIGQKKPRRLFDTDILLDSFLNEKKYGYSFLGGKTGYLPAAGYC